MSDSMASLAQTIAESGASTNVTDIWGDHAASDIRNAHLQEAVEDSLLGDNVIGDHRNPNWFESAEDSFTDDEPREDLQAEEVEPEAQSRSYEAEREEFRNLQADKEELNAILDEAEAAQREQQRAQQSAPPTAEEVAQSIQSLDAVVRENELVDPQAAWSLASDLTVPFGGDPRSVDSGLLGSAMAKTVVSAMQIYDSIGGDSSKLEQHVIPQQAADAFTSEFLRSFNIDPRMAQVDSMHLSRVALGGMLNFIKTANEKGLDASMDMLNDPQQAEWFGAEVSKAFGINAPMPRQEALIMCDTFGKFAIGIMRKVSAMQPREQAQSRQIRAAKPRRQWQSNDDLFNGAAEEYRQHKGRL